MAIQQGLCITPLQVGRSYSLGRSYIQAGTLVIRPAERDGTLLDGPALAEGQDIAVDLRDGKAQPLRDLPGWWAASFAFDDRAEADAQRRAAEDAEADEFRGPKLESVRTALQGIGDGTTTGAAAIRTLGRAVLALVNREARRAGDVPAAPAPAKAEASASEKLTEKVVKS